jgi:hypothetical protein
MEQQMKKKERKKEFKSVEKENENREKMVTPLKAWTPTHIINIVSK